MPIECTWLQNKPSPLERCPICGAEPFEPFMRGMIQRKPIGFRWRREFPFFEFYPRPYCALICWSCKAIVDYEQP